MNEMTGISPLLVITGPTASGKTHRAVNIARCLGGEIISADSRQIYRSMDLGTGKDIGEYGNTPVHLIDICPAGYKYNLFEYLRDASAAADDIAARGLIPIVCGGTGMYVEALVNGLRLPEVPPNSELRKKLEGKTLEELTLHLASMKQLHNKTDVDTVKRAIRAIEIETWYTEHPQEAVAARIGLCSPRKALIIGVDIDRELRRKRITERLHERLDTGMVDEVRMLLNSGIPPEDLIYYGLEYKYLTLYITGELTYEEMVSQLEIAIHQFAKRQMTWFRGMERRGHTIHWLPFTLSDDEFTDTAAELWSDFLTASGYGGND